MRQSIESSLVLGAGHMSRPEAHRLDELSAGYSLAGCSLAVPASAFPAVQSLATVPLESLQSFSELLLSHFVAVSA